MFSVRKCILKNFWIGEIFIKIENTNFIALNILLVTFEISSKKIVNVSQKTTGPTNFQNPLADFLRPTHFLLHRVNFKNFMISLTNTSLLEQNNNDKIKDISIFYLSILSRFFYNLPCKIKNRWVTKNLQTNRDELRPVPSLPKHVPKFGIRPGTPSQQREKKNLEIQ